MAKQARPTAELTTLLVAEGLVADREPTIAFAAEHGSALLALLVTGVAIRPKGESRGYLCCRRRRSTRTECPVGHELSGHCRPVVFAAG